MHSKKEKDLGGFKHSQKERRKFMEKQLGIGKIPWDKFEPGIYNYCDRWCEKCKKTGKCFLYYDGKVRDSQAEREGIDIKTPEHAFKVVGDSLRETGDLIRKISEFEGIDITVTPEDEARFEEFEKATDPDNLPLMQESRDLTRKIWEILSWLDGPVTEGENLEQIIADRVRQDQTNKIDIEARMRQVEEDIENEIETSGLLDAPIEISLDEKQRQEVFEIIEDLRWHHTLFSAKVYRAISGKLEAENEDHEFSLEDSIKSAQVAYRSVKICQSSLEKLNNIIEYDLNVLISECEKVLKSISKELLGDRL